MDAKGSDAMRRGRRVARQASRLRRAIARGLGLEGAAPRGAGPTWNDSPLPDTVERYLRPDNPRLRGLEREYASMGAPVTDRSVWTEEFVRREVPLRYFRGDCGYQWQMRDGNAEVNHLITTYYVETIDRLGLLDRLKEDGLFGAYTYDFNGKRTVSRDLLDSIIEIYFLDDTLGVASRSGIRVLDIGSGYGRLAHRMAKALPGLERVFCVDSVARSTFLAEFYLRFRGVGERAVVVPLQELENTLRENPVEIALNVHCFSECTLASIGWWLDLLRRHAVRYLVLVPDAGDHGGTRLLTEERDGSRLDFSPAIESRGYRPRAKRPKYAHAAVQRYGVSPTTHYLFELAP